MKPWIALLVAAPIALGAGIAATLLPADSALPPVDNSLKIVNHPYVSAQVHVAPTMKSVNTGHPVWPKYEMLMGLSEERVKKYRANHHLEDVITTEGCHVMHPSREEAPVIVVICGGIVTSITERRGTSIIEFGSGGVAVHQAGVTWVAQK